MSTPHYAITSKPSAAKALRKLDRQHQRAIIEAIDGLAEDQERWCDFLQAGNFVRG